MINPFVVLISIMSIYISVHADVVARVTRIEGTVSIMRNGSAEWRAAKPSTPLEVGDQVYTREESFAEIRYSIGTVLRMDEKTKITIAESSEQTIKTRNGLGDVWVNMKKLLTKGKEFDVTTATAVAAIRGTVFHMANQADSTASVSVYNGKVAVGPTDELKKKIEKAKPAAHVDEPVEIPGPEEIPGPFEVPLEQWRDIVAGQKISIRTDGKFAQEKFDMKVAAEEKFVKKNLEMDKELMKEK
jgi:FecR protein.